MGPADQINIVISQEVGDYIPSEDEAHSSFVFCPSRHSFLRIGPEQIA